MAVVLAVGFLVAVFLAEVAGLVVFFSSLTPAALATLARADLRRLAVAFLSRPFLTAVSNSLWALLRVAVLGFGINSLVADLISRLIPMLR